MKKIGYLIFTVAALIGMTSCEKDKNSAPVITSNGGGATAAINVNENTTAVTTVTATDVDAPASTLTYSISGGIDKALFGIDGSTGVLTFTTAPDFENPTDNGADNVYDVQVTVTDNGEGKLTDSQDIAVTVTNLNDPSLVTTSETISLGAGYANDVFYRLSDGLTTSVPRANWDIAFSVSPQEAAILINGASGDTLKAYPVAPGWTWADAIDTTGYYTWDAFANSDTTWSEGAFNMNATGHPNYGWGEYSMVTHNLTGVSLYIITTRDGSVKKIWIENKLSASQIYNFRYSDLDGSNEHVVNINLAGKTKNFIYFSLETNQEVDREPDKDKWDIVFTKYIDKTINYIVTGVLHNVGVTALESTDVDPLSEVMPTTGYFTNISTIGSDWKSFSMVTYQYTIDETRVFLVKDQNGIIHRIRFTAFEGSSTGNISFDISTLVE